MKTSQLPGNTNVVTRRLTPDQVHRGRRAVRALRANTRKTTDVMRDEEGGRCCLCVIEDSAIANGCQSIPAKIRLDTMPKQNTADFLGWNTMNPTLRREASPNSLVEYYQAAGFNDEAAYSEEGVKGMPHSQIADLFEASFPQYVADRSDLFIYHPAGAPAYWIWGA